MIDPQEIKDFVGHKFSRFGINKKRELVRLLFEITKRETVPLKSIVEEAGLLEMRFADVRRHLLHRRYPRLSSPERDGVTDLLDVDVDQADAVDTEQNFFIRPRSVYLEKSVASSTLAQRLHSQLTDSDFIEIGSYRRYVKDQDFRPHHYNARSDSIFVIEEKFDFVKPCPCSTKTVSCGYYNVGLGSGCPYECVYCCLQGYLNSPGIVIPANIDDFFCPA